MSAFLEMCRKWKCVFCSGVLEKNYDSSSHDARGLCVSDRVGKLDDHRNVKNVMVVTKNVYASFTFPPHDCLALAAFAELVDIKKEKC